MTDKLTICDASEQDAAAIAEIYTHYVMESAATFETDPPSPSFVADLISKILDAGYPWLVVLDAQGIVQGYAYAQPVGPRVGYLYSCETLIFVRHDALGRGIGTMLINALVAECERRGFRQAFAWIAGTEPASVVLHARAGYLPCGTLAGAGWKHGRWHDIFMMQRKLGEGSDTLPQEHS